jgi:signal peptide peptidase SppA
MTMKTPPRGTRLRLTDRPLAIAPRAVDAVMEVPAAMFGAENPTTRRDPGWELTEGGIAILPIFGPLLQRCDDFTRWLGIATYDDIANTASEAFATPGVRGVLLEIDSPGGEVAGLFDLVDHLVALKAATGKPLWAVAREQALSAAYAIASVCDRIYVTQTGEVGSVGVLAVHVDKTARDKIEGAKYSLIHAGAKKTDGNPHIPLSDAAAVDIQADVDDLYARFVTRVASHRRVSLEAVIATEAAIYRGQRALEAGLADRIGTFEAAIGDFAASLDAPGFQRSQSRPQNPQNQPTERNFSMTTKVKPAAKLAVTADTLANTQGTACDPATPPAATEPLLLAAPAADPVPAAPVPTPVVPVQPAPDARSQLADSIRAEAAEIAGIAAQAAQLGVLIDTAEAVRAGTNPDALRQTVLEQLAKQSAASAVVPALPAPVDNLAPKESPIVQAAKEAAGVKPA